VLQKMQHSKKNKEAKKQIIYSEHSLSIVKLHILLQKYIVVKKYRAAN
jgi:hypothetical protein